MNWNLFDRVNEVCLENPIGITAYDFNTMFAHWLKKRWNQLSQNHVKPAMVFALRLNQDYCAGCGLILPFPGIGCGVTVHHKNHNNSDNRFQNLELYCSHRCHIINAHRGCSL